MKGVPKMHSDDASLLRRSLTGEEAAFEALYLRYAPSLKAYFRRMMNRNDQQAEDMCQGLFLKVLEKGGQYNSTHSFKTWLYSMAHNMCKNEYRHREVHKRNETHLAGEQISRYRADTELDKSSFKDSLQAALQELDEEKRQAFILRFKHELSIKEIAVVTGAAEGTVKSRLFYTLRELSHKLRVYNPKN